MLRLTVIALLMACGGPDTPPGQKDPAQPVCENTGPSDAPLRKLTRTEYENTVRDITGVTVDAKRVVQDPRVHGFDNAAVTVSVGTLAADGYMRQSEEISADYPFGLPGCETDATTSEQDACAAQFIEEFGRLAFRRPLQPTEHTIFEDLFEVVRNDEGPDLALEAVMQAILQSPQFLYRPEVGHGDPDAQGMVALTDHEVATRLSYLLWGSAPDEALLAMADRGELSNPEQRASEVERMLGDSRARETLGHFVEQWTGSVAVEDITKDAVVFPEWDETLAGALREETRQFAAHVVFDGDGTLFSLLAAPYTVADSTVAEHYGAQAEDWAVLPLDPDRYAGLMTQPAMLAILAHSNQTSIVKRGVFVREHLMCQTLPDPPDELDISLPPLDETLTARERFARHSQDPACSGCHELTDPIGLGFEHHDPLGRWRSDQGDGLEVNAQGTVVQSPNGELDGPFTGVPELAQRLAGSQTVEACFVQNTFRIAWARDPLEPDDCTVADLEHAMAASGGDIQTLLRTVAAHPRFVQRPEVTP